MGRDLRHMGRGDLLDALLEQSKEKDRLVRETKLLREQLAEMKAAAGSHEGQLARLTEKLDAKDAQIERLKQRLDEKDEEIERLQAIDRDNPGTLAAAALKASGVMQAAEEAAAQYLQGAREIEARRRALYQATVKRCREMERKAGIGQGDA